MQTRSRKQKQVFNGGGALPLSYFNGGFDTQLTNDRGMDHGPTAEYVRPALPQSAGARGGFYPGIMVPFTENAARIAVSLAAVAASHYLSAPPYFKQSATKQTVAKKPKMTRKKVAKKVARRGTRKQAKRV